MPYKTLILSFNLFSRFTSFHRMWRSSKYLIVSLHQVEILFTETTTLVPTEMLSIVKGLKMDVKHLMETIRRIMVFLTLKMTIVQVGNMDVCTVKGQNN